MKLYKIVSKAIIIASAILLVLPVNAYAVTKNKIKVTVGEKNELEMEAKHKKEVNIIRYKEEQKNKKKKEKTSMMYSEATEDNPYKIAAIGDSITYSQTYAAVLDSQPHCVVENYGLSGSQVAGEIEHSFVSRTKNLKTDADLILIFGGTNDYRGALDMQNDIGALTDTTVTTFCGAYNTMIENLKKNNPKSKIVLMTPIRRNYDFEDNRYGYCLENYANAVRYIAMKNELPCIDLYNNEECDFRYNGLLIDGLHPNIDGHKIIAREVIKALIQAGL